MKTWLADFIQLCTRVAQIVECQIKAVSAST